LASGKQRVRSRIVWTLFVVCLLLFAAGWTIRSYARFGEQLSAVAGMTLGDTRGEVKYKLGVPPTVSGSNEPGEAGARAYYTDAQSDPANALPDGADIDNYRIWSYNNGSLSGPHIDLTFDGSSGRVSKITCIDHSDPPSGYCGRLLGVGIGDPEDRLTSVLGTPTRQFIDERLGTKSMDYADIGAAFLLAKQRVYGIAIVGTGIQKQPPWDRFLMWYLSELKAELRP
jgi:hypothetical protein